MIKKQPFYKSNQNHTNNKSKNQTLADTVKIRPKNAKN